MTEKILVVEDQPQVVRLVREVLKAVGYQVQVAGYGQQALEMVALEQPDLVVLDWEVLGKRIKTLQELLELFEQPPMIIALSVHEQARNTAFGSGVAGFAYKGDPPELLLSTIRETRPGMRCHRRI